MLSLLRILSRNWVAGLALFRFIGPVIAFHCEATADAHETCPQIGGFA